MNIIKKQYKLLDLAIERYGKSLDRKHEIIALDAFYFSIEDLLKKNKSTEKRNREWMIIKALLESMGFVESSEHGFKMPPIEKLINLKIEYEKYYASKKLKWITIVTSIIAGGLSGAIFSFCIHC